MTTVTLTPAQRNGLHEHLVLDMEGDALAAASNDGNGAEVKALLGRFQTVARLRDCIGWEEDPERDEYRIEVDDEIRALIASLAEEVRGTIADEEEAPEPDERSAEQLAIARQTFELDLHALAACELIGAVA